ncbi:MAG: amino acid adenylation domain-containing protein, partial [Micromonosporaceae bacterium]
HNGQTLTYAELVDWARDVASRLGPRPGTVAVPATHKPATVAALLGIWLAGGVYCPIDPRFPADRQRAMRAAAGVGDAGVGGPGADDAGAREVEPEGAYVLFTSGSTSAPKPVLTGHRAIAITAGSLRDLFGLTETDRVLQFASLNWDTCFEEILPALTSGATLVFHDDAYSGSFPRFLRTIDNEQITVLDLPTAFWHELVNQLLEAGTRLPECLRVVIIGGEAVSPARLADWCTLSTSGIRLINTYGCTETTLITHAVDLHGPLALSLGPSWARSARAPIGRPLGHVVERLDPLSSADPATGDRGELLIGGPSLAVGYRGRPQETAARFVELPAGRFFRTGDRVSRLPNGMLTHEGRVDDTLKIRGVRVDPAEVEAHIAGHPSVSAVAVTGMSAGDHTVLAAFVVPRPMVGTAALNQELLEYLGGHVPAHLIPSRVSIVADLPYTPSGKIDRPRIKEIYS